VAKSPKKTALIFTYYWPPASGPGVQRWLKFVKFLPEYGWDTILVTPKNGSYPNTDPSLLDDLPEHIHIEKTATLEPFRLFNIISGNADRGKSTSVGMGDIKGKQSLIKKIGAYVRANWFIPDARKGWVPFAYSRGKKIIKEKSIDVIITTGPPHSSHLIGQKLQKAFNIPWVADLRDPWTNIYYNEILPRSTKTEEKDQALENLVVQSADAITVVSEGLKDEFESRSNRIEVIPNGYDDEDFSSLNDLEKSDYYRLSYIGNLKSNQNCEPLWQAISELSKEHTDFKNLFRLSFTGNIHEEVIDTLKEYGVIDQVETLPFVKHKEAVKRMHKADSLLFPIPYSPNNEQIVTGKIFEYLASKTPLLSIGPTQGDAAKIILDCKREPMIDYSDKEQIKSRIQDLFEQWKESEYRPKLKDQTHEKFSRKNLTKTLAQLLSEY
jgi:glycosyltransferase involved in cell wall biosynthesis